ncbi:MAG: hypothetical protein ABI614_11170, partial [Planctomycetota bacterium]
MRFSLRCARVVRFAIVASLFVVHTPLLLEAQLVDHASLTSQQRDQLYDDLAAEVNALDAQLGLIKKVIRLVRPTVVHIEASKQAAAPTRSGRKSVEEAGSGIVIEVDSNLYILTNRHVIDDSQLGDIKIKLNDRRVIHPTTVWADRE